MNTMITSTVFARISEPHRMQSPWILVQRNLRNSICSICHIKRPLHFPSRSYSLWEPDYLNVKPEFPSHGQLNVRLRGYDYVVLESFAKYVLNASDKLGLDATLYPVPARTSTIQSFKPNSSHVKDEYKLAIYERVVQIEDLTSVLAPIYFEVLQLNLPAGIQMSIRPPNSEEEDFRYVPDVALLELQGQVAEIDKVKDDRKKK